MAYFMIDLLESELQHASLFYDRCLLFGPCSPPLKKRPRTCSIQRSLSNPRPVISRLFAALRQACVIPGQIVSQILQRVAPIPLSQAPRRGASTHCVALPTTSRQFSCARRARIPPDPRHSHSFSREGPQCAHEWLVKS